MSKHTPGPWKVMARRGQHVDIVGPDGTWLAETHYSGDENNEANARLIAAAPEMRELLAKRAKSLKNAGIFSEALSEISALLSRIDGEGD